MALKSGYLAPETQPEGMICLKVYIPADDLYLYAFGGAYQYLTKWVAWQRGGSRAIEAAAKWRDAYDYTMANGWLNCGEDEVSTINFNPIINVNTSSGSECCNYTPPPWDGVPVPGGTPNYPIPTVDPPINNIPPLPPVGTEPSEWDLYRCKVANYAFDKVREWLVAISEIPTNLLAIGGILIFIWTWAPLGLLAIIGTGVLELASVIFSWQVISEGIDEIAEFAIEWWDDRHEQMVCMFYNMTDINVTRTEVLAEFLNDLAIWAEGRPWWADSLLAMLNSVGGHLFPSRLFLAPWELVPPDNYIGSIDCTLCVDDDGWGEHDRYIWVPLTNALLFTQSMTFTGAGQQNVGSWVLTDDGRVTWSYTDADHSDINWTVKPTSILALVPDSMHVAGVAYDFYYSQPPFADGGSPYWYETVQEDSNATLDVTVNPGFPKKWWVDFANPEDSDVDATLSAIADYDGFTELLADSIPSRSEIQAGVAGNRSGQCRVRFLVKVL